MQQSEYKYKMQNMDIRTSTVIHPKIWTLNTLKINTRDTFDTAEMTETSFIASTLFQAELFPNLFVFYILCKIN